MKSLALSGTEETKFAGGAFTLGYSWSASQDKINNKSTITVSLWLQANTSSPMNDATASTTTITIGEGAWAQSRTFNVTSTVGAKTWKTLGTFTATIDHYSDGTLQLPIRCSHLVDITWSGTMIGTVSVGTGKWALDTIVRAGTMTFSQNWGYIAETAITLTLTKPDASLKYNAWWSWERDGTGTIDVDWGYIGQSLGSTVKWTPPAAIANKMPTSKNTWVYVYLDTWAGATKIGSNWYRFDVWISDNQVPVIGGISDSEGNAAVSKVLGSGAGYLQQASTINASATGVSAKLGATIASQVWSLGSLRQAGATASFVQPALSGTVPLTLTVTDSRGLTATKTKNLTLAEYTGVQLTGSAYRTGEASDKITVKRKGGVQTFGGKNIFSTWIRHRESGAEEWSAKKYVQAGTTTVATFDLTTAMTETFSATASFDIEIGASDSFGTQNAFVIQVTVLTGVLALAQNGIGVNKKHERGAVDVKGDIYANNRIINPLGMAYFTNDTMQAYSQTQPINLGTIGLIAGTTELAAGVNSIMIKKAGVYEIMCQAGIGVVSAYATLVLNINGGDLSRGAYSTGNNGIYLHVTIKLNTGDTVQFRNVLSGGNTRSDFYYTDGFIKYLGA